MSISKIKVGSTEHDLQASKLTTARTIGLGTGATGTATSFDGSANITIPVTSVKEAYLDWGGKNFYGSYGPIDAAMVPELGANRLAFIPASAIVLEYSRDNGSTWSTYSLSDESKINLFNGNGAGVYIGASSATGINKSSYMARVTINTSAASVYTALNKFVIYCSTNGSTGSYCTVQGRLQSNYEAGTETWTTFADKVRIEGWSGYNIINTSTITTYGNTKTAQYGQVRFTFGTTGHSDTNYPGLSIIKIFGFGGVGWTTPSTMAKTGSMYTYDYAQNVTFPAAVKTSSFVQAASFYENNTALSSKYAAKSHKHSVTAAGTNSSTSITPSGTVSQPTFTGTAASHNHTFTGTAAEHNHTFTGTQATASVKYTPAGTVSSSFTGTAHNHTFSGTPATSGKPDTTNVTTIYSITGVGTLPSASLSSGTLPSCSYTAPSHSYTAPSLTGSVSNQCLTLTFNAGSHSFNAGSHSFSAGAFPKLTFSAGSLPTREAVSVPDTNHTHSVTATGTIGNATAGGSVSSTFAGTEATISHTFTPAGSISKTSITPAGTISSKELTPAGTVSKPTFTGTAASHTHTFTGSAVNSATES